MKKFFVLLTIAAAMGGTAFSQEERMDRSKQDPNSAQTQEQAWQGYIVDGKSAMDIVKNQDDALKKIVEYSRATASVYGAGNGYFLYANNQWLKLDDAGNKLAEEVIRKSTKEKGIQVTITGRLDGETIAVASLKEVVETAPLNFN